MEGRVVERKAKAGRIERKGGKERLGRNRQKVSDEEE